MRRLLTLLLAVCLTVGATAWGYWSTDSVPGGNGAAAASSVNQGATPAVSAVAQAVTVSWAASTLANGQAVTGYEVKRYDAGTLAAQTILSSCTGTVTATSCVENSVPAGSWKYAITPVIANNWVGLESAKSNTVTVTPADTTSPTNAITLSGVTGNADKTGNTIYYRGVAAGSFTLTNAVSDAGSGAASSQTGTLTGTTTGWTHTPSTVSAPAGGPYVSNSFAWAAGTTSSPAEAVTGRDVAGNTAVTNLSFVNDSNAPTAGTITYADGYQPGLSVSVAFTTGTDGGSGIGTRQLQRRSAPLTSGTCGTWSGFTNLGAANPTSVHTDGTVANGTCYQYQYVVTDNAGNIHTATSANIAKVDYAGAVNTTTGLLSHWRLGEAATTLSSSDSFNDTATTVLSSHTPEVGTSWTRWVNDTITGVITNENRLRKTNASGGVGYYTAAVPSSANYRVEADVHVKSLLATDYIGVMGRWNISATTGAGTNYLARYDSGGAQWMLISSVNGTGTVLGTFAQTLSAGSAYRLGLDMNGSTIRLLVDGVQRISVTDSAVTAVGRAGVRLGTTTTTATQSDTAGLHLENFQVAPSTYPRADDSKGTNTGDYKNGPTLGATGALAGDTNTAAQFDGVNDYVQMTGTTGLPTGAGVRSVEAWFKTSSAARQVLFQYGSRADTQEFGLWLDAGGTAMSAWGFGNGNDKLFTMPSAMNDGLWHQVVKTYNGTSLTLYVDGVALTPQAATRSTVLDQYGFGVGAIINPSDGNSGGFFTGSIDEVSFYTTTLNQATVTEHYQLGTSSAGADISGPTGGSVDASGLVGTGSRYSTSTTLSLDLTKGTDPSGVAATGHQLLRATATLTAGACGTFGSYTLVAGGADPVSPKADTVTDQACYSYRYVVLDTLANSTTYTSPDIKVDLTAPAAPSLAHSAFTNTYWSTGSTVYYRSGAASGSFTATGTASDAGSGIASYAFPTLGTNWTSTPGALGVNTYSWTGAPAAPGTKNVTATNNATGTSPITSFTMSADNTAPTAGTVTYTDTNQTSTSISVGFSTGTDADSGVATRLLQRASATLTGTTCGTYGAFATIAGGTNPGSSPVVDTVAGGSCYQYRYVVTDNVGNAHTATSASVVKVTIPCGTQLLGNPGFENGAVTTPWTASAGVVTNAGSVAARTGTWKALLGGNGTDTTETVSQAVTIPANCSVSLTYYLRVTTSEGPGTAYDFFRVQVGGVTLDEVSNLGSGISYVQRTVDLSAYAGQTITLTFLSDEDSSLQTSFWLDDVSLTTAALPDTTGPTGGSVDASGLVGTGARYAASTTLSLDLAKGTDPSGVAATGNLLKRATATLTSGGTANGTCGAFGSYTTVTGGTDPVSPKSDTVADQACYSYQYVVLDTLGNPTTYTSPDIKVDLTAPAAPSLAHSAFTNTYWSSGAVVYYRSAASSGSFTTTSTATDTKSGIASHTFPSLGTNWTSTPGALGVNTYSWSGAPAAPGAKNVTATNNATGVSGNTSFTPTADDTAPSAGTVTPPNTTQASTSVSVAYTTGTDGGSGLGTRLLQRQSATLTGSTCGSYGGWTTAATNPGSSPFGDTVTAGFCYRYQYVVSDNVGNTQTATSANVVKVSVSYFDTIFNTTGLLNLYRLGELPASSDSFTDTGGTLLSAHTPDLGTSWTRWVNDSITGVITNANALRKSNAAGAVGYYTAVAPVSADYLVETDVVVKSIRTSDSIGVVGRWNISQTTGAGTNYIARYNTTTANWELVKAVNGTGTLLGSFGQTLSAGTTYRLGLDMNGTTIRLLVGGVQRVSVTDASISTAGRAGVRLGTSSDTATQSDTTGLHLDNFYVTPPVTDSKGTNNGDFHSGVSLGVAGAIANDTSTAVTFDGVDDYASATRQVSDDFSIEFWFKSTQNFSADWGNPPCTFWWQGAGLIDADVSGSGNDFGISLCSGKVIAGVGGTPDISIATPGTYNNGAWHHVVFTRTRSSGAMALYVDGAAAGTATGSVNALTSQANLNFGRSTAGIQYYAGSMDEVAVYTSVLSPATVSAHYAAAQ